MKKFLILFIFLAFAGKVTFAQNTTNTFSDSYYVGTPSNYASFANDFMWVDQNDPDGDWYMASETYGYYLSPSPVTRLFVSITATGINPADSFYDYAETNNPPSDNAIAYKYIDNHAGWSAYSEVDMYWRVEYADGSWSEYNWIYNP